MLRVSVALLLAASGTIGFAQAQKAPAAPAYVPRVGQPGKNSVWIPTPQAVADKMLDMARVTAKDYVMDLGSGDGPLVISAAKRGARAMGVEYNPDLVELSKRNAEKAGVAGRATFVKADLFETDFSQATVITMFLPPTVILKLRPKLLEMKPGTRVVSNIYDMGDWQPDDAVELPTESCFAAREKSRCSAMLWIVPARVAGTYKVAQGQVVLRQQYQTLTGSMRTERRTYALEGKVIGEDIVFKAGGKEYRGKLNGKQLELR